MSLDEIVITQAIIESYLKDFIKYSDVDVAIVGAGPSGMVAAKYLADAKLKVVIFERRLSIGGGIWGGGMMFNKIVVQEEGKAILDEFDIKHEFYRENYYIVDAIETASKLASGVINAGAKILNLITVEDVMYREDKITGVVINWSATEIAKLHVDPMTIRAKFTVDATGHECSVISLVEKKLKGKLFTKEGKILGERSMWAENGEKILIETTKEIYPNLYVTGMAANAVSGGPRMGPIFGGMLISGKEVAKLIIQRFHQK
jgi:thiazole biosynthesis enzyme